jgi:DegV family protein with EDD domain
MAKVKLFTDSSSDLSQDIYKQFDIEIIPFYVTFDKQHYYKEGTGITTKEFFRRLTTEKNFPSTSLPTVIDYEEAFRPYLDKGMDIVCLCITSKFSGSYVSAVNAADELRPQYPDRTICIIDSIQASGGQGITLIQMAKLKDAGYSAKEIASAIESIKDTARVFLTTDTLEYLQKGGRIGKASALAGTFLKIKPIIVMMNAELHPVAKVRGRANAIEKIINMTAEYVGNNMDAYDYLLLHSECYDEIVPVEERMKKMGFKFDWPVQSLGITIGSHIGPTLIATCVVKKYVK